MSRTARLGSESASATPLRGVPIEGAVVVSVARRDSGAELFGDTAMEGPGLIGNSDSGKV
jgi:hypothetical protein